MIVLQVWPLKGSWVFQSKNLNLKRHDPISVDIKPQRFMKVTRLKTYYMILSPLILELIGSWSFHLCYWKWLVHASLKLRLGPHWFTKIVSYILPFSKKVIYLKRIMNHQYGRIQWIGSWYFGVWNHVPKDHQKYFEIFHQSVCSTEMCDQVKLARIS